MGRIFLLLVLLVMNSGKSMGSIVPIENDLQELIDYSYKKGTILRLDPKKEYIISKPLEIKCSIEGNGAVIKIMKSKMIPIRIVGKKIFIHNLNIKDSGLQKIEVIGNGVSLKSCNFKNYSFSSLLILKGNNTVINNCVVENVYKGSQNYAILTLGKNPIIGLEITNSKIIGGMRITNQKDAFSGNFKFIQNDFNVDYSHIDQDFYSQHDGIRLGGIDNVLFSGNKFYFKNVNRGFKFTDYQPENKNKKKSTRPTTNIVIKKNKIFSESTNGKQLFDMYDGSGIIDIVDNLIKSKGHTVIFEDKTTFSQNSKRHLSIINNEIYYDFRLIYYRGVIGEKVSLTVTGNHFKYTDNLNNVRIDRTGNKKNVQFDLKYLVFARDIDEFKYSKNIIYNENYYATNNMFYSIKVHNVKNTRITGNDLIGGIAFTYKSKNKLFFEDNTIFNNQLKSIIHITSSSDELNSNDITNVNNKRLNVRDLKK